MVVFLSPTVVRDTIHFGGLMSLCYEEMYNFCCAKETLRRLRDSEVWIFVHLVQYPFQAFVVLQFDQMNVEWLTFSSSSIFQLIYTGPSQNQNEVCDPLYIDVYNVWGSLFVICLFMACWWIVGEQTPLPVEVKPAHEGNNRRNSHHTVKRKQSVESITVPLELSFCSLITFETLAARLCRSCGNIWTPQS